MTPGEFNYIPEPNKTESPEGFIKIPVLRPKRGKFEAHYNNAILFTARVWFLNAEITTAETYTYSKSLNPFDFTHSFTAPHHKITVNPISAPMSDQFEFKLFAVTYHILPNRGGAKLISPTEDSTLATFTPEWRDEQLKNGHNGVIHTHPQVPALALAILFLSPQLHDGNNSTPEGIAPSIRPK